MTRLRLAIRWTGNFPGGRTINDFVKLTDLAAWPDVYPVPDAATAGPQVTVVKETSPGF